MMKFGIVNPSFQNWGQKCVSISLLLLLSSFSAFSLIEKNSLSLKLEIEHSLSQAAGYLLSQQKPNGSWGLEEYPAFTGLAIMSLLRSPQSENYLPSTQKALHYLLQKQHPDGGFYGKEKKLASYNTAIVLMAFLSADEEKYKETLSKARQFLLKQQQFYPSSSPYQGGIGYGNSYPHSDMSNTYLALESVYYTEHLSDTGSEESTLDWKSALQFVSRTQNLKQFNSEDWVSEDSDNKGGFIYFPGDSKAGEQPLPNGKKALRSYGSMSYVGLLSLIYANLDFDDPRVIAVLDWLSRHYTIEENPGLGQQGLFYYYQAMAKALTVANIAFLETPEGRKDWRRDLSEKLLSLQREDASWINANSRWWENDPLLVTCYAMLTLEQIYYFLPVK